MMVSLVIIAVVVVVAGPVCHVESKPLSAHHCICIWLKISHLFSFRHISTWSFLGSLRIFIFTFPSISLLVRLHGFFIPHHHHCCRRRRCFSSTFRSHHSHFLSRIFYYLLSMIVSFGDLYQNKSSGGFISIPVVLHRHLFLFWMVSECVALNGHHFLLSFLFKYYVLFNTFIYVDRRPLRKNIHKFRKRKKKGRKNNSTSDKHRPIEWEWPKFYGKFFFFSFESELTSFIIENDVINFTNFLLCFFVQLPFPCLQQFMMVIYAKLTHSREFFENFFFDKTANWI